MSRVGRAIILLITGCVILFAGGCSKKTPNESNFREAINHNLSKSPMHTGFYFTSDFPTTTLSDSYLDAMVPKGLVMKTSAGIDRVKYDLTDAGRATSFPARGKNYAFCYGIRKVDKILNFTEPADSDGKSTVSVSYTWKLAEPLPSWAVDPLAASSDSVLRSLQTGIDPNPDSRKAKAILVLTHNGWREGGDTDD